MIKNFLLVGAGGAAGSMLRYAFGAWIGGRSFPWSTFVINVTGSFIIGLVLGYCMKHDWSNHWKLLLATGVCGGFTTFSAFSFENLLLLQQGKWMTSLFYIMASVLLCILAAKLGFELAD